MHQKISNHEAATPNPLGAGAPCDVKRHRIELHVNDRNSDLNLFSIPVQDLLQVSV